MTEALTHLRTRVPTWSWGDRVRKVRREMRMSQADFAVLIGVGEKALAAWESGANVGPDDRDQMAVRLESATGVHRAWWLGWLDDGPGCPRPDSNGRPSDYNVAGSRRLRILPLGIAA